jgi:hypothetical protein
MPQISTKSSNGCHCGFTNFSSACPYDAWAIDLPPTRSGITLDEFLRTASSYLHTPSPVVRTVLNMGKTIKRTSRRIVGRPYLTGLGRFARHPSGTWSHSGRMSKGQA